MKAVGAETGMRAFADARSAHARMPARLQPATLPGKEVAMEWFGTILAYATITLPAVIVGFIFVRWASAARHSNLRWP
jgi:hypothetical protein